MTQPLAFPEEEYHGRIARVRQEMGERGIDVLLVVAPENMYYLTGYDSIEYFSYQMLFVTQEEGPLVLLTRPPEQDVVREFSIVDELHTWRVEEPPDPVTATVSILNERGWRQKRLGIELGSYYLSVSNYLRLCSATGASFIDASDLIAEQRIRKSPREIAYVREAARLADIGVAAMIGHARPGITENELHGEMQRAMSAAGSEYPAIPTILASGWRTAFLHATPTDRRLEQGDLVIGEVGGVRRRYHVTIGRTLSLGQPTQRAREAYAVVQEAVAAAVEVAAPGVPVAELDRAAKRVFRTAGMDHYRVHRTGYGISAGYPPSWLETLNIIEPDPHILEPGMLFSLEPPLAMRQEGIGIKLIDDFLVTESGVEQMSTFSRDLYVIQ